MMKNNSTQNDAVEVCMPFARTDEACMRYIHDASNADGFSCCITCNFKMGVRSPLHDGLHSYRQSVYCSKPRQILPVVHDDCTIAATASACPLACHWECRPRGVQSMSTVPHHHHADAADRLWPGVLLHWAQGHPSACTRCQHRCFTAIPADSAFR